MKRLNFCVMIAVLAVVFSTTACSSPTGGEDNGKKPYEITTADDVINISKQTEFRDDDIYILTSDIDLTGKTWVPIGSETNPFRGTFDGHGYKIKGVKLPDENYTGFFGYITGSETAKAVVKNFSIELADVDIIRSTTGGMNAGGLVGYAEYTNFDNITIIGNELKFFSTVYFNSFLGGIIGRGNNISLLWGRNRWTYIQQQYDNLVLCHRECNYQHLRDGNGLCWGNRRIFLWQLSYYRQ